MLANGLIRMDYLIALVVILLASRTSQEGSSSRRRMKPKNSLSTETRRKKIMAYTSSPSHMLDRIMIGKYV